MTRQEYKKAVTAYSGRLFRYLVKSIRNEAEANDLVQEALMKLWERRQDIAFKSAKSWLFTTAHNAMLNMIKKGKRMERMENSNYVEPSYEPVQFELKELIYKSLDKLPPQQKSIVLLRDLEGYSYKEIGEILQLNESQVKVYLFRARQKVKNDLKGLYEIL